MSTVDGDEEEGTSLPREIRDETLGARGWVDLLDPLSDCSSCSNSSSAIAATEE